MTPATGLGTPLEVSARSLAKLNRAPQFIRTDMRITQGEFIQLCRGDTQADLIGADIRVDEYHRRLRTGRPVTWTALLKERIKLEFVVAGASPENV